MQAEIKKFLHKDRAFGEIKAARVNRYGMRGSIGKRDTPLKIAKSINYDLWLGPAKDEALFRQKLHYDWHWDWNTGSGEMGNWGVHVLDDVRNNIFQDSVAVPKRILGGGGRVLWNDGGQTPNVHFAYLDTGSIPVVIGISNLSAKADKRLEWDMSGPTSGYIAYCEGGRLEGQRGKAKAIDRQGKVVREFKGDSGKAHQQNFIDAIRANDTSILKADVQVGHDSTSWCNLANIASRMGIEFELADTEQIKQSTWRDTLQQFSGHLEGRGMKLNDKSLKLSPLLSLDAQGHFVGDGADKANGMLKREYREGYEVPEMALVTS